MHSLLFHPMETSLYLPVDVFCLKSLEPIWHSMQTSLVLFSKIPNLPVEEALVMDGASQDLAL